MHPGAGAAEQNAPGGGAAEQNAPRGGKTTLFSDKIAFKSNDFQWESRKQYIQKQKISPAAPLCSINQFCCNLYVPTTHMLMACSTTKRYKLF